MGKYDKSGGYAGYNKNNEEREPLDYYATPPEEVANGILTVKPWNLNNTKNITILEPCAGGGHMIKGIRDSGFEGGIVGTDIAAHPKIELQFGDVILADEIYDFCSTNYPYEDGIDYIVMNPPFSLTIPFVNHALDIAKKGVLMFNRLQFVESQKRYDLIFKYNPPNKIYQYVDRINCAKSGDFSKKLNGTQAYAWFFWDKKKAYSSTEFYWIRKAGKTDE